MANLQEIRRRIGSVKNTQKITRAMKLVAASKVRHAQKALATSRTYAAHVYSLAEEMLFESQDYAHPLLEERGGKSACLLVVTSDRGLCGSFNHSLFQEAAQWWQTHRRDKEVFIHVIGKKGMDLFQRSRIPVQEYSTGVLEGNPVHTAIDLVNSYIRGFSAHLFDEVYCFYSRFATVVSQEICLEKMLPCRFEKTDTSAFSDWIIEPDRRALLSRLITSNLVAQQYRILQESLASEQGARMTAMESATNNAGDVLASLTLSYNRLRQDAITREVVEVISGASSQEF